ncbi:MAG: creatininase family protein [Actinobacteria bacterium]|nr:MAG: creatininase family protein [Actinomycetota bacterium]
MRSSSSRWSARSSPAGCGSRPATRRRPRTRKSTSTVWSSPLLYERLTWPEVRRAAEEERVALVPVATLEDHGPHLPIDTDLRITAEICRRAATAAAEETVLLPAIPHGYSPHHMDFPGPITIEWDTFTRYLLDVGRSLARHGFVRMLFVNGHGSNQNLVETAARLVMVEHPETLAAACFYLSSAEAAATIAEVRESERGGMGHACELETSIYLALDPDAVDMAAAVDELGYPASENAYMDWSDGPLKLMPWWSSFSRTGVQGRATLGTAEKGERLLEAAVAEIVGYVRDLLGRALPQRREPVA